MGNYAVRQYWSLPPLVFRMLLCHKADINLQDDEGRSPMDLMKDIARSPTKDMTRLRQLLNEVTESPTVDVVCLEGQLVQRAMFADTKGDVIVFSTDSSVGLYSLVEKRITFLKKLK